MRYAVLLALLVATLNGATADFLEGNKLLEKCEHADGVEMTECT